MAMADTAAIMGLAMAITRMDMAGEGMVAGADTIVDFMADDPALIRASQTTQGIAA